MLTRLALINTLRCDLKCAHCLRGYPEQRPDFPMELLPRLLEEARPFGLRHIALTGGQPGMHPHFEAMAAQISQAGYTWHFVTNGQQTGRYLPLMERHREQVTGVSLSLDGATAQVHNQIRGHPQAFQRACQAALQYTAEGYKLSISASLNRLNQGQVEALVDLALELGAQTINFGATLPAPWNHELVLRETQILALYQQILELCQEAPIKIHTFTSLYSRGGVYFCGNLSLREAAVNTQGELVFCCDFLELGAPLGSLHEHSFAELVERWLEASAALQASRARRIARGDMGEGFDSCPFCNRYFEEMAARADPPAREASQNAASQ